MSAISKIEWCDRTWNQLRGCSIVSPGCVHCYAMKLAHRFSGEGQTYHGLTKQTTAGPQWTGEVRLIESALVEPLSWRTPQRVFVNSMSDLFHESVSDETISRIFCVMAAAPQHTFQILTKRAARMQQYLAEMSGDPDAYCFAWIESFDDAWPLRIKRNVIARWPLPNVWLGVSVEDQQRANERIPPLLQTPAAVRFISAEPLLGPIVLDQEWLYPRGDDENDALGWVIVGGESGPKARPCDVAWIRSLVRQCRSASAPRFVKQLGANVIDRNDAGFEGDKPGGWPTDTRTEDIDRGHHYQGASVRVHLRDRKGGSPAEWPEDLRVRKFPETTREPLE